MSNTKLKIIFFTMIAALIYTGCSKNDDYEFSNVSSEVGYFTPTDKDTSYCLSCHLSYKDLAVKTAYLSDPATGKEEARGEGWGNPHNSFHGGPVPCMSCHNDEWMPLASEGGKCNDAQKKARLSQTCTSCHEQDALYLEKDKFQDWDYSK